jgi:hypothetical protein
VFPLGGMRRESFRAPLGPPGRDAPVRPHASLRRRRSARRGFPGAWVVVSACVLAVSLLWVAMELQRGDQRAGEEAPAPGSPEQPVTGRPAGQEHRLTVELEPVEGTQAELRVSVTNQGDDEVSVALGHAPWPPVGESEPANAYRVVVLATGTSLERPAPVLGTYRFEGQSSQTWRTTLRPGDQARVAIDLASTPQPALALARVVVENAAATDRTECPMLPASVSSSGLSLADRSTPQAPPASAGRPPAPAASAPLPPGAHAPSEATEPSSTQLTSEETRRFELGRATEHRRRGEYAEARRVLDALIRQDPADVEAHHLLGWVCSDLGDDDAARMEFTAVVSLAAPTSEMYRTDKEALERLSGR